MAEANLEPDPSLQAPQRGAVLRFETSPYQPDGGWPPSGAFRILSVALVAGLGLGWLASFVGQWFYLILLFPILLGGGVGAAGNWANRSGKVRNSLVAG